MFDSLSSRQKSKFLVCLEWTWKIRILIAVLILVPMSWFFPYKAVDLMTFR